MGLGINDAYAELELSPGATDAEIKQAWRRLVSLWHPDRNPSPEAVARMQRINQAFDLLRNPDTAPPPSKPAKEAEPATTAEAQTPPSARMVSRRIKLTLEEAAAGCLKILRGRLVDACPDCEGSGTRILSDDCSTCSGSGKVRPRAWYGFYGPASECSDCGGDGRARQRCDRCAGTGKLTPQNWQITVRIPHGVRDGDLLQVESRALRPDQARVVLDLRIELLHHPLFRLAPDGTIRCDMPVDGFAWMAQRTVELPTLVGLRRLTLKRDQLKYRLPGLGFPADRRGHPADMVVKIQPWFPDTFSAAQEALIDQLIHGTPQTGASEGADAAEPLQDWARRRQVWQRSLERHQS